MKVAVSVPDDLFKSGEALTKRLGLSRSRLYAAALADFLAKHRRQGVTDRLNAVYAADGARLDPAFRRAQSRAVKAPAW